jgi:hypothetical protein
MSDKPGAPEGGDPTPGEAGSAGGSPPPADAILEAVRQQLSKAASDADVARRAVYNPDQKRDEDRSEIAKQIIYIFTGGIVIVLILLIVDGWATGKWDTVTSQAVDLLKSILLPVVTLILGYYFGQGGKS